MASLSRLLPSLWEMKCCQLTGNSTGSALQGASPRGHAANFVEQFQVGIQNLEQIDHSRAWGGLRRARNVRKRCVLHRQVSRPSAGSASIFYGPDKFLLFPSPLCQHPRVADFDVSRLAVCTRDLPDQRCANCGESILTCGQGFCR
jgi:hypothetical protein